jgi:aspartate carbamoyltransferase regulatory subunit
MLLSTESSTIPSSDDTHLPSIANSEDSIAVETPEVIRGIVKCNNPKCITNNEPMATLFHVADGILTCHYCEKEQDINKVELV